MRNELRNSRPVDEPDPLETGLAALQPSPSRIDRDAIMHRAGQTAAEVQRRMSSPRRWLWPMATALSLLAAVTFAGLYTTAASAPPRERIVYINRPVSVERTKPKRQVVTARKPEQRKQRPPALAERDEFAGEFDSTSLVSSMARSRYPILLTNADRLPASTAGSSFRGGDSQSFGAMRQKLFQSHGRKSAVTVKSPSLFLWNR